MPLDLPALIPLAVSVLGVLGIGSVIGQWAAGGKDRRAARAAVLEKLAAVEAARWYDEVEHGGDPQWIGLDAEVADTITDAAEIVSRAAWSPRSVWLPLRLHTRRRAVAQVRDSRFQNKLIQARRNIR